MRKGQKRQRDEETQAEDTISIPLVRNSDEPPAKKKWTNKQRVLVFSSRGITHRERHLMQNIRMMLPHSKPDVKYATGVTPHVAMVKENKPVFKIGTGDSFMKKLVNLFSKIAEMKNCNKCIYFENRKKQDLYMWVSNVPHGPSVKFLVENVHTMEELKLTGNCLKGSRPLLSFDKAFDNIPHLVLLKELFVQVFGTPYHHPRSQPFVDHVFTFSLLDNRIWFRNYQIIEEDASLVEIGPRFVLNPIRIFQGSFGGPVLFANSNFVSPNMNRRMAKLSTAGRYQNRVSQKQDRASRKAEEGKTYNLDELEDIFETKSFTHPPRMNKYKKGTSK